MSNSQAKGLNRSGGSNVYRFQGQRERTALARKNIAKKLRATHEREALPDSGEGGSFFHQELVRWKELDISSGFAAFARRTLPKCASMPLLLLNKEEIVTDLLALLAEETEVTWKSVCGLLAVLARDLREEMLGRILEISAGLRDKINPVHPEMTAEIFRTLSFILKYMGKAIADAEQSGPLISQWMPMLGSKRSTLRELTASSLAVLLRKHDNKGMKRCISAALKAASQVSTSDADTVKFRTRNAEFKDGCARLLFEMFRNTGGTLHACFEKVFSHLLQSMQVNAEAGTEDTAVLSCAVRCEIVIQVARYLGKFVNEVSAGMLIDQLSECIGKLNRSNTTVAQCFAVYSLAGVVRLLSVESSLPCITIMKQRMFDLVLRLLEHLSHVVEPVKAAYRAVLQGLIVHHFDVIVPELLRTSGPNGQKQLDKLIRRLMDTGSMHAADAGTPTELQACRLLGAVCNPAILKHAVSPHHSQQRLSTASPHHSAHQQRLIFLSEVLLASSRLEPEARVLTMRLLVPLVQEGLAAEQHSGLEAFCAVVMDVRRSVTVDDVMNGEVFAIPASGAMVEAITAFAKDVRRNAADVTEKQCAVASAVCRSLIFIADLPHSAEKALCDLVDAVDKHFTSVVKAKGDLSALIPLLFVRNDAVNGVISLLQRKKHSNASAAKATSSVSLKLAELLSSGEALESSIAQVCVLSTQLAVSRFATFETITAPNADDFTPLLLSSLHALQSMCAYTMEEHTELLTPERAALLVVGVASLLAHADHAVRYHVLQTLQFFPSVQKVRGEFSFPASYHAAFPATVPVLLDDIATKTVDEMCADAEALRIMYVVEALPNTIAYERLRGSMLQRLIPMLERHVLSDGVICCVCYHLMGLLHVKFAPLWASVQPVVMAAVSTAPHTAWMAISRELFRGCRTFEAVDSATSGMTTERSIGDVEGKSRSQARGDAAAADLMPLKSAYHACHAEISDDVDMDDNDVLLQDFRALCRVGLDAFAAAEPVWVRECVLEHEDKAKTGNTTHENDHVALHLGGSGSTDANTQQNTIMRMLASAASFCEARSRVFVSLFLSFLHGAYYCIHNDDIDSVELNLPAMLAQLKAQAAKAAQRSGKRQAAVMDALLQMVVDLSLSGQLLLDTPSKTSLQARLQSYLMVMKEFRSWDSVVGSSVVREVCVRLLSKREGGIAACALSVLSAMKLPHVKPYEKHLGNLLDDDKFRSELVLFPLGIGSSPIAAEHRAELLPVVFRVMLGRLLQRHGKSAKDSPAQRRSQVLAYCGSASASELAPFLYLLLRPLLLGYLNVGIISSEQPLWTILDAIATPSNDTEALTCIDAVRSTLPESPLCKADFHSFTTASRALGFLNVCKDMFKHLGTHLLPHIHHILIGIVALLRETEFATAGSGEIADVGDDEDVMDDEQTVGLQTRRREIRTIAFQRLADMLKAYPTLDIGLWTGMVADIMEQAALFLPASMSKSSKPSAFLTLLHSIAQSVNVGLLLSNRSFVPSLFGILSAGLQGSQEIVNAHLTHTKTPTAGPAAPPGDGAHSLVLTATFDIIERLFNIDELVVAAVMRGVTDDTTPYVENPAMAEHVPFLLRHLLLRMNVRLKEVKESAVREETEWDELAGEELIVPAMNKSQVAFSRRQLVLLAVISYYVKAVSTQALTIDQLISVLLPYLSRKSPQLENDPRLLIFGTIQRLGPFTSRSTEFLQFLSQLLQPGIAALQGQARLELLNTICSLSTHKHDLQEAATTLQRTYVLDKSKIGELDYDRLLEALHALKTPTFVHTLTLSHTRVLLPAYIHHVLFLSHEKDIALRTAALHVCSEWLKALSQLALTCPKDIQKKNFNHLPLNLRTTAGQGVVALHAVIKVMLPDVYKSLNASSSTLRRGFIVLLADLVRAFRTVEFVEPKCVLHQDLIALINETDPEADIFYNLAHLQIHRRARAVIRLRGVVESGRITPYSLEHVVIPITVQMLLDTADDGSFKDGVSSTLQTEVVNFLEKATIQLDFTSYSAILRRVAQQVSKNAALEKVFGRLLEVMCRNIRAVMDTSASPEDLFDSQTLHALSSSIDSAGLGRTLLTQLTSAHGAEDDDDDSEIDAVPTEGQGLSHPLGKQLATIASVLLPALQRLLFKKDTDRSTGGDVNSRELRPALAVAYVHLLGVLPSDVANQHYPRILSQICSGIRSRDQDVRDAGRVALAKVASSLGPSRLRMILDAVNGSLGEGYQLHITGHILQAVLDAVEPALQAALQTPDSGEVRGLCDALPVILKMIYDDVFGDVAEARDEDSGYKPKGALRESLSCRSFDTMETLGKCIPFLPHQALHEVIGCILSALTLPRRQTQVKTSVDLLMKRFKAGIMKNPTLQPQPVILYAFASCQDMLGSAADADKSAEKPVVKATPQLKLGISPEVYEKWTKPQHKSSRDASTKLWSKQSNTSVAESQANDAGVTAAMRLKGSGVSFVDKSFTTVLPEPRYSLLHGYHTSASLNKHVNEMSKALITQFGLSLLHASIKHGGVDLKDSEQVSMLDSMYSLMIQLLEHCRESSLRVLLIKIIVQLLHCSMPSVKSTAPKLARLLLMLVENTSGVQEGSTTSGNSATSELAQSSMAAVTSLLRSCDYITITEEQQRALLVLVRADLALAARQNAVYALLRTLLARRVLVPEIYDIMDDVAKQMVTSLKANVRSLATACFIQYLLRYPLTDSRLQNYMDFFVRNLDYSVEAGRLSMLDLLAAVITKFPQAVLDEYASYLFLPLALRMANDASDACRAAAGELIKLLISKVGTSRAQTIATLSVSWLKNDSKTELQRIGCQAVGLILDAKPAVFTQTLETAQLLAQIISGKAAEYYRSHAATLKEEVDTSLADGGSGLASSRLAAVLSESEGVVAYPDEHSTAKAAPPPTPSDSSWLLLYHAILSATKLCQSHPDLLLHHLSFGSATKKATIDSRSAAARHDAMDEDGVDDDDDEEEEDVAEAGAEPLLGAVTRKNPVAACFELLLFPHSWIRLAATTLVTLGLQAMHSNKTWLPDDVLFKLAQRFVSQMRSENFGEKQMEATGGALLTLLNFAPVFTHEESLRRVLSRATGVAMLAGPRAGICMVKTFAAFSLTAAKQTVVRVLDIISRILYRLTEDMVDHTGRNADFSTAKHLAQECLQVLETQLGNDAIVTALNKERERVMQIRLRRKKDRTLLKVSNPEAAAKEKAKRSAAKMRHKQKKMDEFRRQRGKTLDSSTAGKKRSRAHMS